MNFTVFCISFISFSGYMCSYWKYVDSLFSLEDQNFSPIITIVEPYP